MSDQIPNQPAPVGLMAAGEDLWVSVAGKYLLRPDERATLLGACRAADMIASLRAEWAVRDMPFLSKGSMGQDVIHPLIGELRAQEAQKAALLSRLKLPDEVDGPAVNQNRSAADSSWEITAKRGGRGA